VVVYVGSFDGIRKYIAEEREIDGWAGDVFGFYSKVVLGLGLVTVVAIVVIARSAFVVESLGSDFVLYFHVVALMVVLRIPLRISRSVLLGFSLERYSEPLLIVDRLIFAAFVVLLSVVGGTVAGILGARTVSFGIASVFALVIVTRRVKLSKIVTHSPEYLPRKQLLGYGISTMALKFLLVSLYHTDIILLRFFVGSAETGYYRAALVIAEFLWFVPTAIEIALPHSTSNLWVSEQYDRITAISTQTVRYTLLFTSLLVLGIAGLARPLLSLYFGQEFAAAAGPLIVLLPGALGFAVARPVLAITKGQSTLRGLVLVTGVAAGINGVLNLILIPRFGMAGAAIATSVGYSSMFGLHVWNARKLGIDPLADLRIKRVGVTVGVAAIPVIGLSGYITSDIIALLIVPPVGFITFGVFALLTGAIRLDELRRLFRNSPLVL